MIEQALRLKVVSRHGVGYDNVDVAALTARRSRSRSQPTPMRPQSPSTPCLHAGIGQAGARYDRAAREGRWEVRDRLEAVDLMGRRVLALGFGRIGPEVASAAPPSACRFPSMTLMSRPT